MPKLRDHLGPRAYQDLREWATALPEAADDLEATVTEMRKKDGTDVVVVQVRLPNGHHHALIIQPDRETA